MRGYKGQRTAGIISEAKAYLGIDNKAEHGPHRFDGQICASVSVRMQ